MIKFTEWFSLKENNSPGFTVDRTTPLARDYRANPYSFRYDVVSTDDPDYHKNKLINFAKDITGQAASQLGSAFNSSAKMYGANPTFGGNPGDRSFLDMFKNSDRNYKTIKTQIKIDPNDLKFNIAKGKLNQEMQKALLDDPNLSDISIDPWPRPEYQPIQTLPNGDKFLIAYYKFKRKQEE